MEVIKILNLDTFQANFDPDQIATSYIVQFPDISIVLPSQGIMGILSAIEPRAHTVVTLTGLKLSHKTKEPVSSGDVVLFLQNNMEKFRGLVDEYQQGVTAIISKNPSLVDHLNLQALINSFE